MLTQRLRHRVDVQELVVTQDSNDGAVTETWESILENGGPLLPAAKEYLLGRELLAAQALHAGTTVRFTIRQHLPLRASMRVVHEGEFFSITAILPDPTMRAYVRLMCEAGLKNG